MSETPIQLLLVDDHQIVLDGIKSLLKREAQFEIIHETTAPTQVLTLLRQHQVDVIIADISMPEMNGIELTQAVKAEFPEIKILALTMHDDSKTITAMLQAGISGYLLKNTSKKELINAIHEIAAGQMYFSNEVSVEMMKSISTAEKTGDPTVFPLSTREIEIVKLIADELSNAEIGQRLFISERTVESHRKNIFRKTNTKSVAGLIRHVMNAGLIN